MAVLNDEPRVIDAVTAIEDIVEVLTHADIHFIAQIYKATVGGQVEAQEAEGDGEDTITVTQEG